MTELSVYGTGETSYVLPDYERILPWKLHPRFEDMKRETRGWIRQFPEVHEWIPEYRNGSETPSLDQWLEEGGGDTFACLMAPTIRSDRILALCQFDVWWTFLDDSVSVGKDGRFYRIGPDVRRAAMERVIEILESPGTPYDPDGPPPDLIDRVCGARLLADVWYRIAPALPAPLLTRFIQDTAACVRLWPTEPELSAEGTTLDFEPFMAVRRRTVAVMTLNRHLEFGLGIDLTHEIATYPELTRLQELQVDYLILLNDLYSFRKEYLRSRDTANLIAVLCIRHHHSLQQAVDTICARMTATEKTFIAERDTFLSDHPGIRPEVREFLDGLGYVMSGTLQFHRTTSRYHGLHHDGHEITSGRITLTRNGTVLTTDTTPGHDQGRIDFAEHSLSGVNQGDL
ncbi:terpene synthase family protein [Streptomyces sp. NPDC091377]|uniref:terpene synthase family protein n=1 Tax=Streptomyces sp. NPDC091377 TaxID=3365995 RepID=UPI00381CE592